MNVVDLEAQSDPPLLSLPSSSNGGGAATSNNTQHTNNTNTSPGGIIQQQQQQQPKIITTKKGKMTLEIPSTTKLSKTNTNPPTTSNNTPATSATAAHVPTHSTTHGTHGATTFKNKNGENVNVDHDDDHEDDEDEAGSVVSSITGAGFDQDLVEELHLALERMKADLEDSRAEASRAVKVAEQAIQSAEHSTSTDWNNTVTHKAAEAAATAQKKAAEALAKARIAEERLQVERQAAMVWKQQVETAEQQAAQWQTRAAAAEVQRFALAEAWESERHKQAQLLVEATEGTAPVAAVQKKDGTMKKQQQQQDAFDPFDTTGDDNTIISSSSHTQPPTSLTTPATTKTTTTHATATTTLSHNSRKKKKVVDAVVDVEVERLRSKLAMESARRRTLLDEVQDLRGAIRVYCRPRAPSSVPSTSTSTSTSSTITMVSNEVLLLHRDHRGAASVQSTPSPAPLCFEFDGILSDDMSQQDVYAEFEAICASVVEGYKICLMTYGQANSGKTHTMLGDIEMQCRQRHEQDQQVVAEIHNHGIHLRAMQQLFSLLEHRRDHFHDTVTMTLVEVHNERLIDLFAGTDFGEAHGRIVEGGSSRNKSASSSRSRREETKDVDTTTTSQQQPQQQPPLTTTSISSARLPKLEIKTNRETGETVLRGVLSVAVTSFADVLCLWQESLAMRVSRVAELEIDRSTGSHEQLEDSHVVATLHIASKNLATGASASGRLQFVDFAASDISSMMTTTKQQQRSSLLGGSSAVATKRSSSCGGDQLLFEDWKFTNKSLNAVRDVVQARTQYQRAVPYRNSTITHILSDSFEADTKVVLIACVSPRVEDLHHTACTLHLAQEMRKVIVGKATRHTTLGNVNSNSNSNNNV